MTDFLSAASPSGRFVKLKDKGDTIAILIGDVSTRDFIPYGESTPKILKSGKVDEEWLISGIDRMEEDEDEASVVLPVNKYKMKQAIAQALKEAGASEPQVGGTLVVTCEGDGVASKKGGYPPKVFSAEYHLPEVTGSPWGAEEE